MRTLNVQELLEGHEDVSVRNYSGRGMYGRECLGIVGSDKECRRVIAQVICEMYNEVIDAIDEEDQREFDRLLSEVQDLTKMLLEYEQDSMGYDVIVYWRNLEYEDEEEYDDEEE